MRNTIKSSGDDVRYALRALKVAYSHLLSAKDSHPCGDVDAVVMELRPLKQLEAEVAWLAAHLDRMDSKRRAS